MGFGYLLLGYLVAFLLYLTVQALGVGSLALLLGYTLMFYGFYLLNRYHSAFAIAKWSLIPLFGTALYRLAEDISALFLLDFPFVGGTFGDVMDWATFFLLTFFQFAMLYGIRMLADSVGLKKHASATVRNTLFVGIYALLYVAGNLPLFQTVKPYLTLSVTLLNLLWVICNLWLLTGCMKDICPAGEEELAPKRSRFAWVNRMGDAYDKAHEKLNEQSRADGECWRRNRQEKKRRKKK